MPFLFQPDEDGYQHPATGTEESKRALRGLPSDAYLQAHPLYTRPTTAKGIIDELGRTAGDALAAKRKEGLHHISAQYARTGAFAPGGQFDSSTEVGCANLLALLNVRMGLPPDAR